jgi:hypothetical protein
VREKKKLVLFLTETKIGFLALRSRIIEILEQRSTDKTAVEFVRRRRETENQ